LKGEADNVRLALHKLWDDKSKLVGLGANEGPHLVGLRYSEYTVAHLKSYGNESGSSKAIGTDREKTVKYFKGIKGSYSQKVTRSTF